MSAPDGAPERLDRLVVAPLAGELAPFARRFGAVSGRTGSGLRVGRLRIQGLEVATYVVGDGPGRSARALERLLAELRPERLLLLGVAGGLSPELVSGDLVRAARVARSSAGPAEGGWSSSRGGDGLAVSVGRIEPSAAGKRELWLRTGRPERAVVDLESATLARLASERGLDWSVIRCVLDPQEEDLPVALSAASDAEGHVSRGRILARVLARPTLLGGLLGLRRRLGVCAATLSSAALAWVKE